MTFIIADDVLYARRAVEKMVLEWDGESKILASCSDGCETIRQLERNRPDILITDIRMPGEDGLALAQIVQKRWPGIHIMLVTGYASFEYAQQAINSGVCSYLLKPLKKQELFSALDTLRGQKKKETAQKQQFERIRHSAESFALTQYLTSGGISGELPPDCERLCTAGYAVAVVSAQGIDSRSLCTKIRLVFGEGIECYEDVLHTGNVLVLLYAPQNGRLQTFYKSVFNALSAAVDHISQFASNAAVGLSEVSDNPEALPLCYQQARRAICMRLVQPEQQVYPFHMEKASVGIQTADKIRVFRSRMQSEKWKEAHAIFQDMLRGISNLPQLEQLWQELLGICYTMYAEQGYNTRTQEHKGIQRQLWDFETADALWNYLYVLSNDTVQNESVCDSDLIESIKAFLEENYYCELSLNELATTRYYMNPNYLSRLFKTKTGKGFARYLLEVRMRKAQEFLRTGKLSISEVAMMVGYTSSSHFIQNFKKVYGETPGNIRVENDRNNENKNK